MNTRATPGRLVATATWSPPGATTSPVTSPSESARGYRRRVRPVESTLARVRAASSSVSAVPSGSQPMMTVPGAVVTCRRSPVSRSVTSWVNALAPPPVRAMSEIRCPPGSHTRSWREPESEVTGRSSPPAKGIVYTLAPQASCLT